VSQPTVSVELNHHAAQLLASLCVELDTDDPSGVISRALGVLEMCMRTRRQGGSLQFVNEHGETSDVVF
jgi:hypothetical protein